MRNLLLLAFPLFILFCAMKAGGVWHTYAIHGYAQGTTYTITYYAQDSLVSREEVEQVLAMIDSSMSLYKPYSLINKINNGEGTFRVDPHFGKVVRKSFEIYRRSGGLFDVTVAPLVRLWGFGTERMNHLPDSAAVRRARACVGMDRIRLRGSLLKKMQPCVQLDLNGIAQGYSVDVLAGMLESKGIGHYLVELGGELRVCGPKPDGTPIRIGIERPPKDGTQYPVINEVLELRNGAVTTAGNYRKFVMDGERRISHHINPETGYPFHTGVISATVYAPDAMTADGYDNVFIAMPPETAVALANRTVNVEVYLIYRDDHGVTRDTMSSGFGRLISHL